MNELEVEQRSAELEEGGFVESFGVNVCDVVFGADPDGDREEREELLPPDVHPSLEVLGSRSGSDVGDGGDGCLAIIEDLHWVLEGDAKVLK